MGVGSLGLVQGFCILWRRIHPVQKNDTHEKIGQIFRKFFPRAETTAQEKRSPPQEEPQTSQTVVDQSRSDQASSKPPATPDKPVEKGPSQEKINNVEKSSLKIPQTDLKEKEPAEVMAPTPTPIIELPSKQDKPTLDICVMAGRGGCEPFVDYLKTKCPPECRFELIKQELDTRGCLKSLPAHIQNRKDLIVIYVAFIGFGRADSHMEYTVHLARKGFQNVIPIFLCSNSQKYDSMTFDSYQEYVKSSKAKGETPEKQVVGQLQGQAPKAYGTWYFTRENTFPKVVDDQYFDSLCWDAQRVKRPSIATPISEIGSAILTYQEYLFEELENEKKEQNKPNTQT